MTAKRRTAFFPETVAREKRSYTGRFLAPVLARRPGRTEAAE